MSEATGADSEHLGLEGGHRTESGSFRGQAKISRRGRPALRLAVWRATWPVRPYHVK